MKSLPNSIGSCNWLLAAASRNQLVAVALLRLRAAWRLSLVIIPVSLLKELGNGFYAKKLQKQISPYHQTTIVV